MFLHHRARQVNVKLWANKDGSSSCTSSLISSLLSWSSQNLWGFMWDTIHLISVQFHHRIDFEIWHLTIGSWHLTKLGKRKCWSHFVSCYCTIHTSPLLQRSSLKTPEGTNCYWGSNWDVFVASTRMWLVLSLSAELFFGLRKKKNVVTSFQSIRLHHLAMVLLTDQPQSDGGSD